jgi:anti-sigma B factor antagonist
MQLTIKSEKISHQVHVLRVSGSVTLGDPARSLSDTIKPLIQPDAYIVLDLGDVSYIDSSGMGAIFSGFMDAEKIGGRIVFARITKRIQDLLAVTKLNTVVKTYDTVQEALAAARLE